jgi:hypothetical protein
MEKRRDFPGRSQEVETFFNTSDATEDPEDPPLNYRGVRTDRYLYAEHGSGEQELYDLRSDPFELQNQAGNPVYAQTQGALRRLLSSQANCAGKTCRGRPALKLKARCSSAKVAGKGKPQEATFYLRGKKVRRDAKPPIRAALPSAFSGAKLEAVVTSLDGRIVTLKRTLHC